MYDPTGKAIGQGLDLLYTITHELVHGLGFSSSWAPRDAGDGEVVTPLVVLTEDGSFHGFFGTAIDRLIYEYPSGQPNSVRIERMNNFRLPGKGHTVDDVVRLFSNSSEFRYARELEEMAVKPHTLALRPVSVAPQDDIWPGGGKLWLETSLPRFAKGRTLSHVSTADYRATADCLMSDGPVNMTEEVVSNARAADPAVPQLIGPGLLSVLEEMGYATMRQPVPVYRPLRVVDMGRSRSRSHDGAMLGVLAIFCVISAAVGIWLSCWLYRRNMSKAAAAARRELPDASAA